MLHHHVRAIEVTITTQEEYNQINFYTLTHGGVDFIHQRVVDAIGAQEPSPNDNPIRLTFALIGHCLHVENGFTGREVQQAQAKLSREKQDWSRIAIPQKPRRDHRFLCARCSKS